MIQVKISLICLFVYNIIGVGKTSLIHKYIHGEFLKDYNITVGVDFKSKTVQL